MSQRSALRILVGFISGFIVGLERQKEIERNRSKQAGLRTFSLIGLTGTMAFMSNNYVLEGAITLSFAFFVAVYAYFRMFSLVEIGVTTPVAMILTYTIGAMAGLGYVTEAITGALISTLILTTKSELRYFARHISKEELISVVELATLLTLIFPIIPNVTDPITGAVNLRTAYFIARLLMTISFINYLTLKILGPKGVVTFGLLGGFVSSEVTTYTVYSDLKGGRIAIATTIASLIALYLKLLLITGVLSRELFRLIYKPILLVILVMAIVSIILAGRADVRLEQLPSPISYSSAVKFTLTFLGISFFVALIEKYAAPYYIIAVILSSLVSVTAVTFSITALLSYGMMDPFTAARYLAIAMGVGALNKLLYASLAGISKKELFKLAIFIVAIAAAFILWSCIRTS